MVTVILPIEEVQSLGNLISKFLSEDQDALVDGIFKSTYQTLMLGGVPFEDLLEVKDAIRDNIMDAIVVACVDNLIDSLGTEGFNETSIAIIKGRLENGIKYRTSHVDIMFTSEFTHALDCSMIHYEIYGEVNSFLNRVLKSEYNRICFRSALLDTITNLYSYKNINMRNVLSSTIVERRSLVLFMRGDYEGEGY